jgi:hypothetical protein
MNDHVWPLGQASLGICFVEQSINEEILNSFLFKVRIYYHFCKKEKVFVCDLLIYACEKNLKQICSEENWDFDFSGSERGSLYQKTI